MYIRHITRLIAPELTPVASLAEKYDWGERNTKIFGRFHAMTSGSLFGEQTLPELTEQLLRQFAEECAPQLFSQIAYVAWAHSLHAVSPFDSSQLHASSLRHLFTPGTPEFFSLTQASCASGIAGLQFLSARMAHASQQQRQVCALLITGEKCFHRTVQYADQNGYFGEGFCATLLSTAPGAGALRLKAIQLRQLPGYATRTRETSRELENAYDRAFITTMLETLQEALRRAGYQPDELRTLIPYHISPVTFDRLADRAGFSRDIIYRRHLYQLGHCFCSDAFINLKSLLSEQNPSRLSHPVLALASGVAGTFAAMVLGSPHKDTP